jgi:alpha-D-xyloside xylohydrolase
VFKRSNISAVFLLAFLSIPAIGQWNTPNPVVSFEKLSNGVEVKQKAGILRLEVDAEDLLHVTYSPLGAAAPDRASDGVVIKKDWSTPTFDVTSSDRAITLSTAKLRVAIERESGAIHYIVPEGATGPGATGPGSTGGPMRGQMLTTDGYRSLRPVEVNGEHTYHAEVVFPIYGSHEGFYGLGQHQAGVWNYRGETVDLSQENTNIAIPLLVSTNGYGIFWNNASRSQVNNRFIHALYLSAEVADSIDYYFIYGPEPDQIVARYRELTGEVPLFGRWAYGFWQCKNKYQSQAEIEGVAAKYRAQHIPVDNIVQDWFWWITMGEMTWNKNYPDPQAMIDTLHKEHFHLMVSIWPYFRPGSATPSDSNYATFDKNGWFIAKTTQQSFHPIGQALYDPTNPAARNQYWANANAALFQKGVDAWWLDTDEPETEGREDNILLTNKLYLGSGARYANIYPLFHTEGVSEGQQAASQQKRVFILSRSAYAGAQRYGVTAWSGDVLSDWLTFQRQIPAGLNYAISGMPYWTTDIGGFISGGNLNDPKFRELFVRWFQFGAFSPIFRVHGTRSPDENELWSYGPDAEKILIDYDNLRYRLMPYIYSQAWQVTSNHGTLMRPLVMDWRQDVEAQNTGDEYLFGPAILVSPVYTQGATSRSIYLPQSVWYDFWTGEKVDASKAGQRIQADAPLSKLPLYIRAGSIIPMGPKMEWTTEKPADPIELRIYQGANGDFTFYEDQNDGYQYQKGAHATTNIHWDDATKTLTLSQREGTFQGMLPEHTFHVVLVSNNHGAGIEESTPNKTITYTGANIAVSF